MGFSAAAKYWKWNAHMDKMPLVRDPALAFRLTLYRFAGMRLSATDEINLA
jgi:hypothetical protein